MRSLLNIFFYLFLTNCTSVNETSMRINKIDSPDTLSFSAVSKSLEENTEMVLIENANWKDFPYTPGVGLRIAHSSDQVFLKFYVSEKHILAQHTEPNKATHKDSCVEFFIDPNQGGNYYNFEFNCIGATHLAYGPDRYERSFIDPKLIKELIFTESTLGNKPFKEQSGNFQWEMVVAIPTSIFIYHPNLNFDNLNSKANFFKCGDDTQQPHYLSWNPIDTPKPDFHRPEFFGNLFFN